MFQPKRVFYFDSVKDQIRATSRGDEKTMLAAISFPGRSLKVSNSWRFMLVPRRDTQQAIPRTPCIYIIAEFIDWFYGTSFKVSPSAEIG